MVREFTNGIYPRSFWVFDKKDLNAILSAFEPVDEYEVWDESAFAGKYMASAKVCHKGTQKLGYIVMVPSVPVEVEGPLWKHASHEAVHCAIWCCGDLDIGITGDNQEPLAYLTGYYTDCIMQQCMGKSCNGK